VIVSTYSLRFSLFLCYSSCNSLEIDQILSVVGSCFSSSLVLLSTFSFCSSSFSNAVCVRRRSRLPPSNFCIECSHIYTVKNRVSNQHAIFYCVATTNSSWYFCQSAVFDFHFFLVHCFPWWFVGIFLPQSGSGHLSTSQGEDFIESLSGEPVIQVSSRLQNTIHGLSRSVCCLHCWGCSDHFNRQLFDNFPFRTWPISSP
jgi:hypothetical protein